MASLNQKLCLMKVASVVAQAIVATLPDEVKPDPEGVDPSVVKVNEMGLRMARTVHAWLCQSVTDPAVWPKAPDGVDQLALLEVSAHLAAGVIVNMGNTLPLDVTTADPKVVQSGAAAWRIWRTYYAWLCASLNDPVMWPDAPDSLFPVRPPVTSGAVPTLTVDALKAVLPLALKDQALVGMIKSAFLGV